MQDNDVKQQKQSINIKWVVILGAVLVVLAIALLWLYSYAFIHITVSNSKNGEVTYRITDQKSGKATVIKSGSHDINQMIPRGSYEISVTQNQTNFYKVVDTGAFLTTTSVTAQLQPEKSRSFVGNGPGPCMDYLQEILFSYSCGSNFDSFQAHLPASGDSPTMTQTFEGGLENLTVGGTVEVNGKSLILLNGRPAEEGVARGEVGSTSIIYELHKDLTLTNSAVPIVFAKEKSYQIKAYKQGFVLYDAEFKDILYYEKLGATPQKIKLEAPKDTSLKAFELSVQGNKLAVAYSNNTGGEETEIINGKTSLQIYEDGKTKSFNFESGATYAQACGENDVCFIYNHKLTVYDIKGDTQKEVFTINGVKNSFSNGNNLIVVRSKDVLGLNMTSRVGSVQYSFGDYTPCGSQEVQGGYLLCVINPKNERSALFIDTARNGSDTIDKKVLSISNQSYIDSVSAYKSYLYIVPKLGEPVYDPVTNTYISDPVLSKKVSQDIDRLITKIGIDKSKYTIINTQP